MNQDPQWHLVICGVPREATGRHGMPRGAMGGHGSNGAHEIPREAMGSHGETAWPRDATGSHGCNGSAFKHPTLGVPLGGPFLVDCCLPVCFCMYLLTLLSLLSLLLAIFIHNHTVDPVPGVLLLLHFPRFPFHDSTGFRFPCISLGKQCISES